MYAKAPLLSSRGMWHTQPGGADLASQGTEGVLCDSNWCNECAAGKGEDNFEMRTRKWQLAKDEQLREKTEAHAFLQEVCALTASASVPWAEESSVLHGHEMMPP